MLFRNLIYTGLTKAKALLQSDLWSADTCLVDRLKDESLLAERDRLRVAINKIDGLL